MKYLKKNKGITLVALVITVIILIILAGITIATVVGQDGLISKSLEAKQAMRKESIKGVVQRDIIEGQMNLNNNISYDQLKTKVMEELQAEKLIDDSTQIINDYIVIDNKNIISMYTGMDAVIGTSEEWGYRIQDANNQNFTRVGTMKLGADPNEYGEKFVDVDYLVHEEGNEQNEVAVIYAYYGTDTVVTIPEIIIHEGRPIPVTELGDKFYKKSPDGPYLENLTTVNISTLKIMDNVKIISAWSFQNNPNLTTLYIGNGVEFIRDGAFSTCPNLTKVQFGDSIKYIGYDAFLNTNIDSIRFPNSLVMIGSKAFWRCTNLKYLNLGDNISTIGWRTFAECYNLEYLHLSSSLTEIPYECFAYDNGLIEIGVPGNVKKIGERAFGYVGHEYSDTGLGYISNIPPKLERIYIDSGVETIEFEAFTMANSSKNDLILPSTVTSIGTNAFLNYGTTGGGKVYRSDGTIYPTN